MEADQFIVRFWGSRGSYPVPGPHTLRYGGNTTCVEVQVGNHILIIDAGTGIINLGYDLLRRARENGGTPITATLLLTHMHHDHTQGFPFFVPAYIGTSTLHILGPRTFDEELEETLNHAVLPPNFPVGLHEMPSLKMVRTLHETELILMNPEQGSIQIHNIYHSHIVRSNDMVCIRIHRSLAHPRDGVYVYRIDWRNKSMVFSSDTEGYVGTDQRLVNFARDTNLIVHDAQYTHDDYIANRQGWGHSTPEMACDVAKQCGARQLVLCHHEPRYDDEKIAEIECEAQRFFPNTIAAYEGLEIVL
jgi:phosphoribosyl 1,2-cyclic phosphodiesterase